MTDPEQIYLLEFLSSHAWIAKEEEMLGGWLLRANDGVTRRANSVLPMEKPPTQDLENTIQTAMKFYQTRNLPTLFQLSEISQPSNLDEKLNDMGFEIGLEVYLQIADIAEVLQAKTLHETQLEPIPSSDWMDAYAAGSKYVNSSMPTRRELMLRSPLNKTFSSVIIDNKIAGVGLCIVEEEWAGLYNMATRSEYRRRGVATALCIKFAGWAESQGAKKMYLQVEINNAAAIEMYGQLGFETAYKYWYRRHP